MILMPNAQYARKGLDLMTKLQPSVAAQCIGTIDPAFTSMSMKPKISLVAIVESVLHGDRPMCSLMMRKKHQPKNLQLTEKKLQLNKKKLQLNDLKSIN